MGIKLSLGLSLHKIHLFLPWSIWPGFDFCALVYYAKILYPTSLTKRIDLILVFVSISKSFVSPKKYNYLFHMQMYHIFISNHSKCISANGQLITKSFCRSLNTPFCILLALTQDCLQCPLKGTREIGALETGCQL